MASEALPRISVNANLFRLAYSCASTEATRYYLNGVYIEPADEGVHLVATDGHRLIVVLDRNGFASRPAIIQLRKDVLSACKPKRSEERDLNIVLTSDKTANATVSVKKGGAVAVNEDCEIDGTFPEYRRVVPAFNGSYGAAAFNPKFIRAFGDVGLGLQEAFDAFGTAMVVHASTDKDPAIITWGAMVEAFGVLMPMRADLSALPKWFPPAEEKQAA